MLLRVKKKLSEAKNKIVRGLALAVIGCSIGWLVGMSVSPVVHIILGSAISLVAGLVTVTSGLSAFQAKEETPGIKMIDKVRQLHQLSSRLNVIPMAVVIFFITCGAATGVYTRTNDLLGPSPRLFYDKWKSTGLSERNLTLKLYEQLYPTDVKITKVKSVNSKKEGITDSVEDTFVLTTTPPVDVNQSQTKMSQLAATLYSLSVKECDFIRLAHGQNLYSRLQVLNDDRVDSLLENCDKSDSSLENIKKTICSERQ